MNVKSSIRDNFSNMIDHYSGILILVKHSALFITLGRKKTLKATISAKCTDPTILKWSSIL